MKALLVLQSLFFLFGFLFNFIAYTEIFDKNLFRVGLRNRNRVGQLGAVFLPASMAVANVLSAVAIVICRLRICKKPCATQPRTQDLYATEEDNYLQRLARKPSSFLMTSTVFPLTSGASQAMELPTAARRRRAEEIELFILCDFLFGLED